MEHRNGELWFRGRDFTATTYLEADFGEGEPRRTMLDWHDGDLSLSIAGLSLPAQPFAIAMVNLPPGGGRGPCWQLSEHLGP